MEGKKAITVEPILIVGYLVVADGEGLIGDGDGTDIS